MAIGGLPLTAPTAGVNVPTRPPRSDGLPWVIARDWRQHGERFGVSMHASAQSVRRPTPSPAAWSRHRITQDGNGASSIPAGVPISPKDPPIPQRPLRSHLPTAPHEQDDWVPSRMRPRLEPRPARSRLDVHD